MRVEDERHLCEAIVHSLDVDEPILDSEFTYDTRRIDLNRDGRNEVVVWSRKFGGTSGYPLLIYTLKDGSYENLYNGLAWSPVILDTSGVKDWKTITFLRQGGGVEPHFVKLRFLGKRYKESGTSQRQPKGKIIFEKASVQTYYGPIRSQ